MLMRSKVLPTTAILVCGRCIFAHYSKLLVRLVCAGVDNQVKVWDIRMLKPLHEYFSYSPATTLDISQRGLLAVGYGRKVQVRGQVCRARHLLAAAVGRGASARFDTRWGCRSSTSRNS